MRIVTIGQKALFIFKILFIFAVLSQSVVLIL